MSTVDTRPPITDADADDLVAALTDDDDEVLCNRADSAAVASLVVRCCGAAYLVCDRHLQASRRRVAAALVLKCKTCNAVHVDCSFDEVYRVVPL